MKKAMNFLLLNLGIPLIYLVVRLIGLTWRFKELNKTGLTPFQDKKEIYIYGFMHSQLIPTIFFYRGTKTASLASQHKDGEIAARAASMFGMRMVRGSSTRGGAGALIKLKTCIEEGWDVAITVDGPRGPVGNVNNGVLYLGKLTGKKVVPVAFYCDKKLELKSWDRMVIPLLFSKGGFMYGLPFEIPADADEARLEEIRRELIKAVKELNEQCKAAVEGKNGQ